MADELSDADIGLSDNDIGLGEAQSPQPAPAQAQGLSDADIGLSDSDIGLDQPQQRPQAESELKTFGREAAHGVLPAAGGLLAGAGAGAAAGAFLGPVGAVGGAIIGGLAGAYGTEKLQEAALDEYGLDDAQQRAINAQENPKSAFAGQMAPALATMRPDRGASVLARGVNAGLMGGIEAGQELYSDGTVSPGKVAASAVAGAVLPTPNRVGSKIIGAGENLGGRIASKVPGRPGREANPASVPEQAEADQANDQPITTGEVSLQQSPPAVEGDTVGNPASAPERSERQYSKESGPTANAPDMLTQGDFTPDVAQALQATTDPETASVPRVAAEGTWLDEAAPSPNPKDFGYNGTKPIDTGIVEAAQAQPPAPAAPAPPPAAQEAIARSKANASKPTLGLKQLYRNGKPAGGANPDLYTPQEGESFAPREENKAPNLVTERPLSDADIGVTEAPANPIHDKIVEAREAVAKGDDISPAQASADNYAQGHPGRMFGRQVTLETPKGGVRVDKSSNPPKWRTEDHPTDYFKILGTKGADGDHLDMHYVGTGDRHFIIDQRNPETGKFDEHKVMSYAKDAADAADHYDRSFSDGKGMDRLGAIKEVSADDLKAWLAKPGKKRTPFDENFKEGAGTAEAPSGLTTGEKPLPKVVTAAVTKMRERGLPEDAITRFMQLEPSKRLGEASKFVNESEKVSTRPDRIRTPAPTIEGLVNDEGKPVTARSKSDAANKSRDVQKMNDAYEAVKARMPETLPTTPEQKRELYENLQSFLNATKDVKYRPNFKHAPYLLARAAKKLTLAKNPSEKGWTEFAEVMHQLRAGNEADVRQGQRIEADIGRQRGRSGDDALANAEAKNAERSAGTNDVEDAMIRAIDARRGYIDVPHEEAEDFVTPKKVETAADIKEPKGTIDITKPEGKEALAKALDAPKKEEPAASEVRKIDVSKDKAALNAKYAAMLETAKKKGASHDNELRDLAGAAKTVVEHFLSSEEASLNVNKIMGDVLAAMKGASSHLAMLRAKKPTPKGTLPPLGLAKDSFAREPTSLQEDYARSMGRDLHTARQQNIEDTLQGIRQAKNMPEGMDHEAIYLAREAGKMNQLPAEQQAHFDQHLKGVLDENDQLVKNIRAIKPDEVGPEVLDHISRLIKGGDPKYDLLAGKSVDPLENVDPNAIATRVKGPLLARRFVGLERQDGKRFVISLNDDGFRIWQDGKSQKVVDPTFKFEAGKSFKVGNNTFKMTEAMTPEIEQHARGDHNEKLEYYKNAALSAITTNIYLKSLARNLQLFDNITKSPIFEKFATKNKAKAHDDWIKTSMPNFDGWRMAPQLAHVLDDYAKPGFQGLDRLRNLSQAVTKTIFWMPTAHIDNVGTHWFVGRGADWLPTTGNYRRLYETAGKAITSVITQDEYQSRLRNAGAGTVYGGILSQNKMEQIGKAVGETIRKNPAKWDPIARTLGVGPSTLADWVYKGASRVMWAANDMFLTQAIMENEAKGMSLADAIQHAERHIPNYQVPATIGGTGNLSRIVSQGMQDGTVSGFGRYHYGVFNSYAHIVKGLTRGTTADRKEAVGNLMAMGILAFAIYPALDKAYQSLTGNPDATAQRRGPLSIPHHLNRAREGKEDVMSAARSTFTTSPLLSTAGETLRNQDFTGAPIVSPGTMREAGKGNVKAMGRAVAQEAGHAASGLVSPIGTFGRSRPDEGVLGTLRDQALDIKNPSPAARKRDANIDRVLAPQERSRFKHPKSAIESGYNKVFGR